MLNDVKTAFRCNPAKDNDLAAVSLFLDTNIAATTYVHMLYNPYREATLGM